ncbi:MAG TPA: NosD domain-containing protein [Candidatus Nanoarchaeia archaeon]|nr:NosD domain-containing protein [Candidatus Nanoarchaeia archaeon]
MKRGLGIKKNILVGIVFLSVIMLAGNVIGAVYYVDSTQLLTRNYIDYNFEFTGNNIILDCQGYKIGGTGSGNGVYINGQSNITIKNCNITGFTRGVYVVWGNGINISFSTIENNSYGIVLDSTDSSVISKNIINNNNYYGIELRSGTDNLQYNVIDSNVIKNNKGAGIYFGDAPGKTYNNITKNTIINNSEGIYLYQSSNNNIIKENKIIKNIRGIKIQGLSKQNEIYSNIIRYNTYGLDMLKSWDGRSPTSNLFYNNLFNNPQNIYNDQSSSTKWNLDSVECGRGVNIMGGNCWGGNFWSDYPGTDDDGDGIGNSDRPWLNRDYFPLIGLECGSVITNSMTLNKDLNDCEGVGLNITANNVILDCNGHSIIGNKTSYGIYSAYKNNLTIKNCIISNFTDGIYLSYASNSTLYNNILKNNTIGMIVLGSSNINITKNTANNNSGTGIAFSSYSHHSYLGFNTVNYNRDGLSISGGDYNIVTNNNASFNKGFGIRTEGFGELYNNFTNNIANNNLYSGILLTSNSNNSIISSNTLRNNNQRGIYIYKSSNEKIYNNIIVNNTLYGIILDLASNNNIYNNFFDNTVNAFDNSVGNSWNTTKICGTTHTNIVGGNCTGGNYWSNYAGIDNIGEDKIGDTLLPYNSGGNIIVKGDYLPLVFVSGGVAVNCSDYTTKSTCFAASVNCTWTPLYNASGGEILTNAQGGGCCPKDYKWDNYSGQCGKTFEGNICTIPVTQTLIQESGLSVSPNGPIRAKTNPTSEATYEYCAQVTSGVNYGLWYDIKRY